MSYSQDDAPWIMLFWFIMGMIKSLKIIMTFVRKIIEDLFCWKNANGIQV